MLQKVTTVAILGVALAVAACVERCDDVTRG
jgi:hypothetical protein